jgi:hypothetical protein
MEQVPEQSGDTHEITTHDEPVVYNGHAADAPPPVTFAEAERHNPYTLLTELYDHARTFNVDHERPPDAAHHLAELALSTAVVS